MYHIVGNYGCTLIWLVDFNLVRPTNVSNWIWHFHQNLPKHQLNSITIFLLYGTYHRNIVQKKSNAYLMIYTILLKQLCSNMYIV